MGKGKATLKVRGGRTIAEGKLYNGLYLLESREKIQSVTKVNTAQEEQPRDWLTWHKHYGHVAFSGLKRLQKERLVEGLNIDENSSIPQCEACIQAKQTCDSFPRNSDSRSGALGELTHSDVWGPARVQSVGGSKYYISFIDD
ncbi:uncharacterized protein HD556DRAFT_1247737, partial [Suillus plorans]